MRAGARSGRSRGGRQGRGSRRRRSAKLTSSGAEMAPGGSSTVRFSTSSKRGGSPAAVVGIEAAQALAGHGEDDAVASSNSARGDLGGDAAVAEHGGAVAERQHLGQAVGDEDHRRRPRRAGGGARRRGAATSVPESDAVGSSSIRTGGRVARARTIMTRWRCAAVSEATSARGSIGRPRSSKSARRARLERAAVDEEALAETGVAGEDVLGDRELLEDLDLLRHVDDAGARGVGGGGEAHRLAVEDDLAGRRCRRDGRRSGSSPASTCRRRSGRGARGSRPRARAKSMPRRA